LPPKSGSSSDVLNFAVKISGEYRLCKAGKKNLIKAVKRKEK